MWWLNDWNPQSVSTMTYQAIEAESSKTNPTLYQSDIRASDTNRGCLLHLFNLISAGAAVVSTTCSISLAIFMVISIPVGEAFSGTSLLHLIIQCGQMVLLFTIIMIEMEWSEAIRTLSILQSWGIRGLCYVFVGLLIFQEFGGFSPLPCTSRYPLLRVSCVLLVILGLTYSIMVRTLIISHWWLKQRLLIQNWKFFFQGILSLKKVRDTKMARYIQLLSHFEVTQLP